jgi:flagellar motor switch protein FliN/FliY
MNEFLSREEKEALHVQQTDGSGGDDNIQSADAYLSPLEQDALGEIGNITFGSAATALSTLLKLKVDITTPRVTAIPKSDLYDIFPNPHIAVHVDYVDGFQGINLLVIKKRDAQVIADLMLGGHGDPQEEELNEIHVSAVQEAMNQMMGSSATSMSSMFNRFVNISPPSVDLFSLSEGKGEELLTEDVFIAIMFRIKIGDLIDSRLMQLLPIWFAKEMVAILMGTADPPPAPSPPPAPPVHHAPPPAQHTPPPVQHTPPPRPAHPPAPPRPVHNAQFSSFSPIDVAASGNPNLQLLMDIPLQVTVELGRTRRQIREILDMSQGFIIELDKLAGEPVDVFVNHTLIAKGEVVVIDENFGVRVTDIISPQERLQRLK